jgi:hypothetical protein
MKRRMINDINSPPFVTSINSPQILSIACPEPSRRVEGTRKSFSAARYITQMIGAALAI